MQATRQRNLHVLIVKALPDRTPVRWAARHAPLPSTGGRRRAASCRLRVAASGERRGGSGTVPRQAAKSLATPGPQDTWAEDLHTVGHAWEEVVRRAVDECYALYAPGHFDEYTGF